jgi:hypothetical protein
MKTVTFKLEKMLGKIFTKTYNIFLLKKDKSKRNNLFKILKIKVALYLQLFFYEKKKEIFKKKTLNVYTHNSFSTKNNYLFKKKNCKLNLINFQRKNFSGFQKIFLSRKVVNKWKNFNCSKKLRFFNMIGTIVEKKNKFFSIFRFFNLNKKKNLNVFQNNKFLFSKFFSFTNNRKRCSKDDYKFYFDLLINKVVSISYIFSIIKTYKCIGRGKFLNFKKLIQKKYYLKKKIFFLENINEMTL